MSADLTYSDATKLAELIRTKEVSPVEIVQAHLNRIEALNPKLNAVVTVTGDALRSAKAAEEAVMEREKLAPCTACRSPQRIRSTQRACSPNADRRSSGAAAPTRMPQPSLG
jgi:hypothetical protein